MADAAAEAVVVEQLTAGLDPLRSVHSLVAGSALVPASQHHRRAAGLGQGGRPHHGRGCRCCSGSGRRACRRCSRLAALVAELGRLVLGTARVAARVSDALSCVDGQAANAEALGPEALGVAGRAVDLVLGVAQSRRVQPRVAVVAGEAARVELTAAARQQRQCRVVRWDAVRAVVVAVAVPSCLLPAPPPPGRRTCCIADTWVRRCRTCR